MPDQPTKSLSLDPQQQSLAILSYNIKKESLRQENPNYVSFLPPDLTHYQSRIIDQMLSHKKHYKLMLRYGKGSIR